MAISRVLPSPRQLSRRSLSKPKYFIGRDIPNVGSVTAQDGIAMSQKSCSVLNNPGTLRSKAAQRRYPGQNLLRVHRAQ
jgi:hypothetical protein